MNIINENEYADVMNDTVLPYLSSVEKSGVFKSFDGAALKWYFYSAKAPRRTVVILHGFTESSRKFHEMIWYFINTGSNVCIYDQRGHADSFRHVDDPTLTHVEHFEDYVTDLEIFMERIVPKDLPLVLYAHSMGGAVASLYIEKNTDVFSKVVLTSPMIAPARGNVPLFIGKLICRFFICVGKAKERIFLSGEYTGEEKFENACSTSRARFDYYEAVRRTNPTHRNYSPTYRWTLESLCVTSKILKKNAPEKIKSSVLLCIANGDDVVLIPPQKALISRIPKICAKSYNAKHELYRSTDNIMADYVNDVLEFVNEQP